MRHRLILVFALVGVLAGGQLAARQLPPPSPNPQVKFNCGGCPYRDNKQRQIDAGLETVRERLDNIRSNQQALGKSIARHAADIARHTADAASGKPGAADAAGQAKTRLGDAAGQLRTLNDAFKRTINEESKLELEKIKLRQESDACRAACPEDHTSRSNTTGPPLGTAAGTGCQDCEQAAVNLKAAQDALNQAHESATKQLLEMAVLQLESAGGQGPPPATEGRLEMHIPGLELYQKSLQIRAAEIEVERQAKAVDDAKSQLNNCEDTNCKLPTPISRTFVRPLLYAGGGVVAIGTLMLGREGDSTPTLNSTPAIPPTANQPPVATPAPPVTPQPPPPSCTEFSGTYSFAGTLRTPRSCFFTGTVPYFQSPIAGTFVLQLDAACSGTLTTRHPNSWTFMHRVTGVLNGTAIQLRSSGSFSSTQPFGTPFFSTIELTKANNTYSGVETHTSGGCTDVYDLRDNR